MQSSSVLFLTMALTAAPALGAETAWVELMPAVNIRLISSDVITDKGSVWMGLEIDMPEDTKTYWRVPGESGIPMAIDATASTGVGSIDVSWPYPRREIYDGYLDHSYYGHTVIPLQVGVEAEDPRVALEIMVGICSDICVPAQALLDLTLELDVADAAHQLRIRQALSEVPLAHEATELFGEARFDPGSNSVVLERHADQFDPASMIAELDGTTMVFDAPKLSEDGDAIVFPVLGRVKDDIFAGGQMRFSYDTDQGSFETWRPLVIE